MQPEPAADAAGGRGTDDAAARASCTGLQAGEHSGSIRADGAAGAGSEQQPAPFAGGPLGASKAGIPVALGVPRAGAPGHHRRAREPALPAAERRAAGGATPLGGGALRAGGAVPGGDRADGAALRPGAMAGASQPGAGGEPDPGCDAPRGAEEPEGAGSGEEPGAQPAAAGKLAGAAGALAVPHLAGGGADRGRRGAPAGGPPPARGAAARPAAGGFSGEPPGAVAGSQAGERSRGAGDPPAAPGAPLVRGDHLERQGPEAPRRGQRGGRGGSGGDRRRDPVFRGRRSPVGAGRGGVVQGKTHWPVAGLQMLPGATKGQTSPTKRLQGGPQEREDWV